MKNATVGTLALALIVALVVVVTDRSATASGIEPVPAQTKKKKSKIQTCVDACISTGNVCKAKCDETHKTPGRGRNYCKESCSEKVGKCRKDCSGAKTKR